MPVSSLSSLPPSLPLLSLMPRRSRPPRRRNIWRSELNFLSQTSALLTINLAPVCHLSLYTCEKRVCLVCNTGLIEDEFHFVMVCNTLNQERNKLLYHITQTDPSFMQLYPFDKLLYILMNETCSQNLIAKCLYKIRSSHSFIYTVTYKPCHGWAPYHYMSCHSNKNLID